MTFASFEGVYDMWRARRLGGLAAGPTSFCTALASSPLEWLPNSARLVFRADPTPVLGILDVTEYAANELLDLVHRELVDAVERSRFVGQKELSRLVRHLASSLNIVLGKRLEEASVVEIPRGGLFVKGYLSYRFPLPLFSSAATNTPVFLVDDISLSGRRVTEWIDRFPDREIIVATLFSPPQVRDAVIARHGERVSWINAEDMKTFGETAPHPDESDPPPWRGITEHICFPWTEPDRGIRLKGTSEFFTGFRLIPPEHCLKNQVQFERNRDRVKIVGNETGWIKTAPGVLWADIDDVVHLADTERGRSQKLEGSAAQFWISAFKFEKKDDAIAHLARLYDIDKSRLEGDFDQFIHELVAEGIVFPAETIEMIDTE
jgi:hypothetical protein